MIVIGVSCPAHCQDFVDPGAVDVVGGEGACAGAVFDDVFVVVNKIRRCPVDRLADSSVEGVVTVAGGHACLACCRQAVFFVVRKRGCAIVGQVAV